MSRNTLHIQLSGPSFRHTITMCRKTCHFHHTFTGKYTALTKHNYLHSFSKNGLIKFHQKTTPPNQEIYRLQINKNYYYKCCMAETLVLVFIPIQNETTTSKLPRVLKKPTDTTLCMNPHKRVHLTIRYHPSFINSGFLDTIYSIVMTTREIMH